MPVQHKTSYADLTAFLESRDVMDIAGNALLILQDDKEIYRHTSGKGDCDTLYRVFSMTKPVTVTATMQLWEKGLLSLEDPISRYLPEYENVTVWDDAAKACVPANTPVTIRHLLTMTAGFCYGGDWAEVPRRTSAVRAELEKEHPGSAYTTREFARAMAQVPLAFQPGTHWQYSLCHDILGAVIEQVSGMTLGAYMKQHIFDPLGMAHTFFRCPEELQFRMAEPRDPSGDASYGARARYESGGGGLLSTIDDYMTFANTLTRGGISEKGVRILKKETIDLIRQDQLDDHTRPDYNWSYLKGYGYGLGMRTLLDPALCGIPGSKGEFGWCGVLGTWVLMDPERRLTVVYMHQHYPNYEEYVQTNLRRLIYGLID